LTTRYRVEVFHTDAYAWLAELQTALSGELRDLGVHRSVDVVVSEAASAGDPVVGVYFGSPSAAGNLDLLDRIAAALGTGVPVIPVVSSLAQFSSLVPPLLHPMNGWPWVGATPALRLARLLLEELGIEDRRRRVFISHKRDDGMAAAEQLHDFLSHHGFEPFIDRFGVRAGDEVQSAIADALEDCAFLLLLETPLAHTSEWVYDEVEYAQSHLMGMHIVSWPGGVTELPATHRWPRHLLEPTDLTPDKGYDIFTAVALDALLSDVEAIHANALVRRRRYLLRSAEEAAQAAGFTCTPLGSWRLLVETATGPTVVQVSARLPRVDDLYELDKAKGRARGASPPGVLVHSARLLRPERRDVLTWSAGARELTLIPENAIGGHWS
jgi:hypothetical protein